VSAVAAAQPQADVTSAEAYAARLYERHSRAIFGICLKQLRRREDADDAVQTTFIYALLSLRRGVIPQMELPWLITIAKNVCSTRRRSGMRRGTYETPQDLDTIQDKLATPDRSDVATSEDFRTALRAIPESQRRALLLREWKGLSYDEIGTELGLSQAATEALLFRARQNVAQQLGGKAGRATLNGLPFFSFLRNLFQTAAAKTVGRHRSCTHDRRDSSRGTSSARRLDASPGRAASTNRSHRREDAGRLPLALSPRRHACLRTPPGGRLTRRARPACGGGCTRRREAWAARSDTRTRACEGRGGRAFAGGAAFHTHSERRSNRNGTPRDGRRRDPDDDRRRGSSRSSPSHGSTREDPATAGPASAAADASFARSALNGA